MIDLFRGEHYFLSSMYPIKKGIMTPEHVVVPTVEHLYQMEKFTDPAARIAIAATPTGFNAKNLAKKITAAGTPVRADWEDARLDVMRGAVLQKFTRDKELEAKLVSTGTEELVEGNTWGDTFWGVAMPQRIGRNMLGKILMETRSQLSIKAIQNTIDISSKP